MTICSNAKSAIQDFQKYNKPKKHDTTKGTQYLSSNQLKKKKKRISVICLLKIKNSCLKEVQWTRKKTQKDHFTKSGKQTKKKTKSLTER